MPQRRHSSHDHHTHLKPSSVIDHLKLKVRRKKLTKSNSSALSDGALNENINNNNNNQRNEDHAGSLQELPTPSLDYQPILSLDKLEKTSSNDINENQIEVENNVFIENNEQDAVVPNGNDDKDETVVQWRTSPKTYDTNQKLPKSKQKALKLAKTSSDASGNTSVKKRRQTVRRTGFQIRDEDFKVIFSDLPSDEQLVIAYPCAWRKDVFMHGRMFLSVNYLCFYTCFFKWEESLCIPYKNIESVTREKSVKVVPNAIKLRTTNGEQYVFASTVPREKIFITIFRLWQNTLLEQPLDYNQLRALIFVDQHSPDETSGESEGSISLENTAEDNIESPHLTQSLPVPPPAHRSTLLSIRSLGNPNRRVVSLPPDTESTNNYLSSCNCESHLSRSFADRLFTLRVDTLYEYLFCDNSFTADFHKAQKLTDYHYGEWRVNKETGLKERLVTYKTVVGGVVGTNSLSCREKQTLEVDKPNSIYVLSSEVYNEGMKYTDSFYVATKFCMIQKDAEYSSLKVTAEVKYIKNVYGLIKTFIERNAHSSIEEGVNEQIRRLEGQQVATRKSHKKTVSISKNHSINNNLSNQQLEENPIPSSETLINQNTFTGKGILYDIALLIGIFLLLLHIYLCYKLYAIDQSLVTPESTCITQCQKACLANQIYRAK